jgi:hypothetical protein
MCVHMVHFYHYRAVLYPPFGKWTIPPQWLLRKGTQFK